MGKAIAMQSQVRVPEPACEGPASDVPTPAPATRVKPRLRGVLHQWAALVTLGAGLVLVAMAPTARARWSAGAYVASAVVLFTVSAVYHRPTWTPRRRALLRRLDHASIFLLIAGTYTPISLLGMPRDSGAKLLATICAGAAAGVVQSIVWIRAPKALKALLYVFLGWTMVFYWHEIRSVLSPAAAALMVSGGLLYSLGAVIYAVRRPDPMPEVFGYHEIFHALTIVACGLHFSVVMALVRAAAG